MNTENNKLFLEPNFEIDRDKEYEMEIIYDFVIYVNKVKDQLPRLYYLLS